jgi:hypothetical protein
MPFFSLEISEGLEGAGRLRELALRRSSVCKLDERVDRNYIKMWFSRFSGNNCASCRHMEQWR